MNIIINTACNCDCDYCFAKEKSLNLNKNEMSIYEFKKIISFMKKSSSYHIRILGGEPTLHSKFKEIINLSEKYAQKIDLFTNGLADRDKIKFLKNKNINYIVNFTARKFTKENKKNLSYFLKKLGRRCTLGINYNGNLDRKEIEEIIKTIKKYNLIPTLRLGISAPTNDFSNNYFNFKKGKKTINKDLRLLSKKLFDHSITITHDCSCFPVCALSDNSLSFLKKHSNTEIRFSCYGGTFDILPGNKVIRCFAHSGFKFSLNKFEDINDINYHFYNLHNFLKKYVKPPKCEDCEFESKVCQSGCWANRLSLLTELPNNGYNFSKNYLYFENKNRIALINKEDFKKQILLEDSSLEIFKLLLSDISKENIIKQLSRKYSTRKGRLIAELDGFLDVLKKKEILI